MQALLTTFFLLIFCLNSTFAATLIKVNINEFQNILQEKNENKILFFFTTWCIYCKPFTLSHDLPKNQIMFVSIDENENVIENFASRMDYDVYHIKPSENYKNLIELSKNLNIKFVTSSNGKLFWGVPYIALLNENNQVKVDNIKTEHLKKYFQ